jgi:hypothetical protein
VSKKRNGKEMEFIFFFGFRGKYGCNLKSRKVQTNCFAQIACSSVKMNGKEVCICRPTYIYIYIYIYMYIFMYTEREREMRGKRKEEEKQKK